MQIRELLRHRLARRTRRGARDEQHHLALVLEGGGMRGVVVGGIVSSLEEHKLLSCFDSVHGSSAGACAAAYFAAGQAQVGTSIFYEDINNSTFIDLTRALRARPIMDVHYLTDVVMRETKPLDVASILAQPGFVNIVTTRLDTGQAEVFNTFGTPDCFFRVLKASSMVPLVAGLGVRIDNVVLIDGALTEHIAVASALRAGASHILVGLSRRAGETCPMSISLRYVVEKLLLGIGVGQRIADLYETSNGRVNAVLDGVARGWIGGARVDMIARSPDASAVGTLTIDEELLRAAAAEGSQAAQQYLSG